MKDRMKRQSLFVLLFAAVAAMAAPGTLGAQVPTPPPTPTPNPQIYTDDAMRFRAPDQFHPVMHRYVTLDGLDNQQPAPLAVWAWPDRDNPREIILSAEGYTGDINAWESDFQQQIRQQSDGTVFRDKTNFALKNGMPAAFMTYTSGQGFDVKKFYVVIWADSQRGMVLQLVTRLDDITDAQARAWLSDVSAVRYPLDR